MGNELIQPFVKWVGGKRQLITKIDELAPRKGSYARYYEPFLGGGAVLFNTQPNRATVNDFNEELINVYLTIKNNVDELILDLQNHENNEGYFYEMREQDRKESYKEWSNIRKASRFIYLNKTCYNGLYRVNSQGFFNSPFGKYKNPNIVNEFVLKHVSNYLNKNDIKFISGDYEKSLKGIRKNSFVYFDPPYAPVSQTSNFTGYTLGGFNEDEQIRLKKVCDKLDKKGVKFLLSNSNVPLITELYKDYEINVVDAKRSINSDADKRGSVEEVLIRNYN
ncbi:DNA adenine methylase [uncultured Enterococcus sp.]|uniref:DNA adenine methylase n=1 Tax=uncultured Enterococcus sp. TaxID=167972 RepID=UPI00280476FF|nr:DNA adenine methylase [uncultured Enterococcus sp.]